MEMDILFLDVDGVLNPDKESHEFIFAPDCVKQLRRILDHHPQSYVVFSTSWRTGFSVFTLGWLWRQHDLPLKRVIGRTPDIETESRGVEIHQWLADAIRYRQVDKMRHYAVLDDEVDPILEHIPAHSIFACDPWHGLTEEIANRVIRHFAAPPGNLLIEKPRQRRARSKADSGRFPKE